jgi:hypothetical protein
MEELRKQAKNNGNQKVPFVIGDNYSGITKREYFAVMALKGLMYRYEGLISKNTEHLSIEAVRWADELLVQLEINK